MVMVISDWDNGDDDDDDDDDEEDGDGYGGECFSLGPDAPLLVRVDRRYGASHREVATLPLTSITPRSSIPPRSNITPRRSSSLRSSI